MMNAEENLDIDLNLNDDHEGNHNVDDVRVVAPFLPKESPLSPPITPMYTQNLINDDGGRNTDDDMKVYESLSSDSSVSEPTIKRTPYGKKRASGLFKSDQAGDVFAAVASKANITGKQTPGVQVYATAQKLIPTSAPVDLVSPPPPYQTTPKTNEAVSRSTVKCLFPDDKNSDDFLKTSDVKPTSPSYGVKLSEPISSNVNLLTNAMNECTIYDKGVNNTTQASTYTSSNYSSPMYGARPELQSGTPMVPAPISGSAFSPFAFQQKEEVHKSSLNGSQYANVSENSGTADLHSSVNTSHCSNGPESSKAHIHNYSGSCYGNEQRSNSYSKSTNKSTDNTQNMSCTNPVMYNPSTFTSPNILGGNLQNHTTEVQNSDEAPIFFNNSQNRIMSSSGNLQFTSNATNKESAKVQKKDDSPLFIPQMYNSTQSFSSSSYFVPQEVDDCVSTEPSPLSHQNPPSPHVIPPPSHVIPPPSHVIPPSSHVIPPPSHVIPPSSHMYPPSSYGTTPSSHTYPQSTQVTSPSGQLSLPSSLTYASAANLNPPLLNNFNFPPSHVNNNASPPNYEECVLPDNNCLYDISPLGHKQVGSNDEKGIFAWLKGTVAKDWSTGAHTLKRYVKTATDSVLTTLDPGMKDYLSPGLHIHTTSQSGQSVPIMVAMKEGFRIALHREPTIEVHMNNAANPLLPIGFEGALQNIFDQLEYLKSVQQDSSWDHVLVVSQVFLTELVSGKWYVMYCMGLEDSSKDILLHTFSQPTPLPMGCITSAYNYVQHNERGECIGYTKTIDDIVRCHVHYERDWCLALTGTPLHQIITTAVQCLALDYQRHVSAKNNTPQQVANNSQTYSTTTTKNNYPQHQNQYGVSIDAIT